MSNIKKSATLKGLVDSKVVELMPKTTADQVYFDDDTKLSDKLSTIGDIASKPKYPLGTAYFNYGTYFVGKDLEESARMLSRYDLICCEGAISKWEDSEDRQNELELVKLVRKYNPNVKFFRYISVNSKYDSETDSRIPINKYDMYQEIRATLHMGGTWTTNKDEDGYDIVTGGIAYDGIFWDEFGSHAGVSELNEGEEQSWPSVVEKQNDLIEEARRLGLCSFGNEWHVINMVSGTPMEDDEYYNPNSVASSIGENDYLLVESCEFYPNDPVDGYGYWGGVDSAYKIYNYMKNYYPTQKAKLVAFSSAGDSMTIEEKQRALTWMIFNTIAMGGHYICFDQGLHYELPEMLQNFYYEDRNNVTFTMADMGNYKMQVNGHALITKRDSGLTGKVNLKSFKLSHIYIDGIEIKNIFTQASELGFYLGEKIENVENQLASMDSDIKENVSRYQRLMIDDWVPVPTPASYPNLIPETDGSAGGITISSRDGYSFAGTVVDGWGSYRWSIDATNYQGKTIEIGCSSFEVSSTDKTKLGIVVYDGSDWDNRVVLYPTTSNTSNVGNKSGINITYDVSEVQNTIVFGVWAFGATADDTFTINDLYLIDPSSVEELSTKYDYTNRSEGFSGWVDNTTWAAPTDPPYTIKLIDDNSLKITYNETGYSSWSGICVVMNHSSGVLKPGSKWEIGCKSFESNAGDNIKIRLYVYSLQDFTSYIVPSNVEVSKIYGEPYPHITVTIPETAKDATGCYVEILNLSDTPYNTDSDGNKTYHEATITDFYMCNVDEENVIIRGVDPANTWLQICRVKEEILALNPKLISNALYITDKGHMFITDFSGNRLNLINTTNDTNSSLDIQEIETYAIDSKLSGDIELKEE